MSSFKIDGFVNQVLRVVTDIFMLQMACFSLESLYTIPKVMQLMDV